MRRVVLVPNRPPQRGSLLTRLELGLAAFAPAFGLLAFRSRCSGWALLFVVPAALGVAALVGGALVARRASPVSIKFGDISDLSGEVLGHIGAYLLPIFVGTSASTEEIIISAAVVGLIVQIHVATGRVFVNPLLYLFGFRIYSADGDGRTFYLVARSDVSEWSEHRRCARIGSSVLIEKGN